MTTDIIAGFPGETAEDFEETMDLLDEVQYDGVFAFKYSPRPNTPSLAMPDSVSEEEKSKRLQILLERQREIQRVNYEKHVGQVLETMVEGMNPARGQVVGRTSQNKTLNFTAAPANCSGAGNVYVPVLVTKTFPNSLVGEEARRCVSEVHLAWRVQ